MTDVQKKLLELLTELDEICKRENIKYYLCDESAHAAVMGQNLYKNSCRVSVAMTPDNVRKFIEAVKKENRADRIVDCMMTNKSYPEFSASYCDSNTTMVELPYKEEGRKPYIGVTIHIIRLKPKSFRKYYKLTKNIWEYCRKNVNEYPTVFKKTVVFGCKAVKTVLGEANLGRLLFKTWCSVFTSNRKAKKMAIGTGTYCYDTALMEKENSVMLNGGTFSVFGDVELYLNKRYSCDDFRVIKPKYPMPSATTMISSLISYNDYMEKAKQMGVDFELIEQKRKECSKLEKTVSEYNKRIGKYYAIVERTEKRFAMYEKYMPMKNLLLNLYKEKQYENLKELLGPYFNALKACHKKGLGLCFDKEIFEIAMNLLEMEDQHTYVNQLRAMVPEAHWEAMTITDYKGELIEITDISDVLLERMEEQEESE